MINRRSYAVASQNLPMTPPPLPPPSPPHTLPHAILLPCHTPDAPLLHSCHTSYYTPATTLPHPCSTPATPPTTPPTSQSDAHLVHACVIYIFHSRCDTVSVHFTTFHTHPSAHPPTVLNSCVCFSLYICVSLSSATHIHHI